MRTPPRTLLRCSALCGLLTSLALAPGAARAQPQGAGGDSATVRLIQLLIEKGILNKQQAASLLAQAQSEATIARRAPARRRSAEIQAETDAEARKEAAATPQGEVRVTYVPQFVRDQIAKQVQGQMLRQMEDQGWAQPNQIPDWIQRITIYGDLRLRYQQNIESRGNIDSATGLPYPFPDFNAINAGSGYDTSGAALPPLLNVSQNREFYQVRARVGVHAAISDWISTDIRIATGNDNNPVSENQTFGNPGDYAKYAIWLDRAYFTFTPAPGLRIMLGRTPNPYYLTNLMYAPDLNFDGAAVQYQRPLTRNIDVFFNGGAHPVFNTALNFSSTSLVKGSSHDAYELAAQAGLVWRIDPLYTARLAAGYFGYSNVSGSLSAPCLLLTSADTCSTDDTRPAYLEFGNTLFALRNIITNASSIPQTPEYYGLSSHFGLLDVHGEFDLDNFDPVQVTLQGEFIKNLAFNRSYILARDPVTNIGSNNHWQGGDTAYLLGVIFGTKQLARLWDWNLDVQYRYLESDSLISSFTDQNFHLGGTNARGYMITGNLGLAPNTYLTARWSSASQISGPPNGNDMLQIDLNTSF